jgi:phytoene dehydrogenase-like protein
MEKSVVIIGAGIAGLSAGCYARMNGYKTTIVEMHDKPGGLCTAWERKGYKFDSCIHWLVGSKPGNDPMRQGWEELGAVQGKTIIDHDIFLVVEGQNGEKLTVYEDADKLREEMLRISPRDKKLIVSLTRDIKVLSKFPSGPPDPKPGDRKPGFFESIKGLAGFLPAIPKMIGYGGISVKNYTKKFKNGFLGSAISEIFSGIDQFTMLGLVMTLAWMHDKNAGYPVGGSLAFAKSIEARYIKLGGEVLYKSRVEKIIVNDGKATGVKLADKSGIKGDIVISAADGHAAIYDMLDGRYKNAAIDKIYGTFERFPAIVQVSLGVAMDMTGEPQSLDFQLQKPINTGGSMADDRMSIRIYAFDKTMAPAGKTAVTTYLSGDYEFWTNLRKNDKSKYNEEKKRVGNEVVDAINSRYPGLKDKLEVIDVATPATFTRYTGNWLGSFEGWLMTPKNAMTKIPTTLPGLANFHMIGQWVAPGGGLPSGLMTGKEVIKKLCKQDGKLFVTSKPQLAR